ncbi:hypothetical protein LZ30DRAFT_605587 [Colletotrichum cereale]|nr:hypothetical protein LZ30DRAFT_605587 [Colletotrichum cereale]
MTKICIKNVAVFDSQAILKPGNVIFTQSAGNVQSYMADDSNAETSDLVVDSRGCSLLPRLIDVCVNIKGANAALSIFASYGITTVIDTSSSTLQCQAMHVYAASKMRLPTFFTCRTEAVAAGDYQLQLYDGSERSVIRTREDAVAFVSARASGPNCADFINVAVNLQSFNNKTLKTIVDAAHTHSKLTIAHTARIQSYVHALVANFNVFIHTPLDAPIDQIIARKISSKNKIVMPTLAIMQQLAPAIDSRDTTATIKPADYNANSTRHNNTLVDPGSVKYSNSSTTSGSSYNNAIESMRTLHNASVTICAGTTANLVPGSQIPFSKSLHEELRLLVKASMPLLDVLRLATCVAAKAFSLDDRSIVQGGLQADLLLVNSNPQEDISIISKIKKI